MPTRCVAAKCSNTHQDGVSLFLFPSDDALRKEWVRQIKRTRDYWKGPSKSSVLCSAQSGMAYDTQNTNMLKLLLPKQKRNQHSACDFNKQQFVILYVTVL